MKELQILLQQHWVIKSQTPELYYQVKDQLKYIRNIMKDKFGYAIIVNPYVIKLEKIPGYCEPWMGIQEFQHIKEYQMLCYILMYLEDKEIEQQFILSDITEFIQMQFGEEEIDWTVYITRKQFVRVIKYCVQIGLLNQTDGEEDAFTKDINTEVLYENTGISKYYLRHFSTDIMEYESPLDFQSSSWFDTDEDRGLIRRHRIYRRLLLSPGVYRDDSINDDFSYIRNYRSQIEKDFSALFPCDLHVHLSSAYLVLEEMKSLGKIFPRSTTVDEIVLYICNVLQKDFKKYMIDTTEQWYIQEKEFLEIINKAILDIYKYLPKSYRDKGEKLLAKEISNVMLTYGFIDKREEEIILYPIIGKVKGYFNDKEVRK